MAAGMDKRTGLHGILTILCVLALTLPTVAINQYCAVVSAFPMQEEQESETKSSIGSCAHRDLRTGRLKPTHFVSPVAARPDASVPQFHRILDAREVLASRFLSLRC